jgi:hypothetical protein
MDDFIKVQNVLLTIQEKHFEFFEQNHAVITDYVEFKPGALNLLKIKPGLPPNIVDEIYSNLRDGR